MQRTLNSLCVGAVETSCKLVSSLCGFNEEGDKLILNLILNDIECAIIYLCFNNLIKNIIEISVLK